MEDLNLKDYEFDKPDFDLKTDYFLLELAKENGFYCKHTPYNSLFSKLFFSGGKLNFKKDLDESFKAKAVPYLRAFMGSFEPSHEEKEAVCTLILSELVDIE